MSSVRHHKKKLASLSALGALGAENLSRGDSPDIIAAVTESTILEKPSKECAGYIEHFLRWHISLSGGKDMTWILHLNGTNACQVCYHDKDGLFAEMEACMKCHEPFAVHFKHFHHCRKCLSVLNPDPKVCKLCFLDAKHKVHTKLCHVDNKVKSAMERMRLQFGLHF
ncbi:unnamed protein product [Dibothriocephalus latus]|uniref:Uncharacterized protein n=1 Tax=Dibothriocephalus latus TaxID=60516 RepID=A0A3P7LM08_DIBLA|nr:unnamed protein product [Dibothriocephalus latus]